MFLIYVNVKGRCGQVSWGTPYIYSHRTSSVRHTRFSGQCQPHFVILIIFVKQSGHFWFFLFQIVVYQAWFCNFLILFGTTSFVHTSPTPFLTCKFRLSKIKTASALTPLPFSGCCVAGLNSQLPPLHGHNNTSL